MQDEADALEVLCEILRSLLLVKLQEYSGEMFTVAVKREHWDVSFLCTSQKDFSKRLTSSLSLDRGGDLPTWLEYAAQEAHAVWTIIQADRRRIERKPLLEVDWFRKTRNLALADVVYVEGFGLASFQGRTMALGYRFVDARGEEFHTEDVSLFYRSTGDEEREYWQTLHSAWVLKRNPDFKPIRDFFMVKTWV